MSDSDELSDDELMHYGILRKSGRYPWGSGGDEYTRSRSFQGMVADLKKQGVPYKAMAQAMGIKDHEDFTLTQLRDTITIAKEVVVREQTVRAIALKDKNMSIDAISKQLGIPPATVRLRIKESEDFKKESLQSSASKIRQAVDDHDIVDIGKGLNLNMDLSPERFRAAVSVLRDEGYKTYTLPIKIPGSANVTNNLVLVKPGTTYGEARRMTDRIHSMVAWSEDGGKTQLNLHPPLSFSSKRLAVLHAEDGGTDKDGVVYVRPGVKDLDMGKNKYAQVRIMIDDTHYIKGMAVLSDDIPAGKDLLFHTNKSRGTPLKGDKNDGVLKNIKDDKDNPFGSTINRQILEKGPDGKERVKSALNMVYEEGDWDTWSKSLPSQMLAKQPHSLIRSQLKVTVKETEDEIGKINSITNPVLRKKMLEKLADRIDSDAVDLRAAAMPKQHTQVIIPVPKLNQHEVYAPRFATGDRIVLIRYPHGGRFEIPEVTVNNNHRGAKKLLGDAPDAIGIHPKVAQRLSGADFDGDTVVAIANPKGLIRGHTTLGPSGYEYEKGLNSFDPKRKYGGFVQTGVDKKGDPVGNYPLMKNTGLEMGKITNLITDMSIQGAKPEHMVRAIKHSMVVIDAEKHKLDYRSSEKENGIRQLQFLYRGTDKGGAATLLSRATAKVQIPERKLRSQREGGPIDPVTGKKVFVDTGRMVNTYDAKTGTYTKELRPKMVNEKRLALTDDAHTLVSPRKDPVELLYADHANTMKGMANSTRLMASRIPTPKVNTAAKKEYAKEIESLTRQLREAQKQKPLDRQAIRIANATFKQKLQEDPSLRLDRDRRLKVERQSKEGARDKMGLKKHVIDLTDREWDAIQAGAVSAHVFNEILTGNYVSQKRLFELAIPKPQTTLSGPVMSRVKAMLSAGMTNADIAASLGIPASSIRSALKEE